MYLSKTEKVYSDLMYDSKEINVFVFFFLSVCKYLVSTVGEGKSHGCIKRRAVEA